MEQGMTSPKADQALLGHRLADMGDISLEEALRGEQTLLRLANPSSEELNALAERFALDELHLKDIRNPIHPPYFSRLENGALHIILRFPVDPESEDEASEVSSTSILADSDMCVLIWPGARHHRFAHRDLAGLDVDECVSKIIHILVDHLLARVYVLREEMEEFEDECLTDVGKADLNGLLQMRKELASLARLARTNTIAIEKLRMDEVYHNNLRLIDAQEHMQRAAAIAESRAEHALNVMQAVQSLLSQRLNDVMKFIAVITVIMTPMGIIAGIFGMNFTNMEILSHPHGFALSIWGMVVMGLGFALFFKIRKWW
jgi:magnesium transporter